jgi:hypothetical protein
MNSSVLLYHVTDRANRESIRQHGIDWRKMGTSLGIAGSRAPEHQGVFLAEEPGIARFFVDMARRNGRHAIDVWEVDLDLDFNRNFDADDDDLLDRLPPGGPLIQHGDGFLCYLEPIPPERLRLIDPDALRE